MRLWRTMKQPSWQQITDHCTKGLRPRPHMCARDNKTTWTRSGYGCNTWTHVPELGGIVETSSSYFKQNSNSMYTQQVGYGSVPDWHTHCRCRYCHHTLCIPIPIPIPISIPIPRYKYRYRYNYRYITNVRVTSNIHLNNAPKEHKLDSLKTAFKGAANETPTCEVSMHVPQTNSLCRGGLRGEQRVWSGVFEEGMSSYS